jgi:tetratricopeptide (TPR) repeat protein
LTLLRASSRYAQCPDHHGVCESRTRGSEVDEDVRKVTELEVLREALGKDRPDLVTDFELRYPKANGLKPRTVARWEGREHAPCTALEECLCDYFKVGAAAVLGLGPSLVAARWWTHMTPEEMRQEVLHRRKMLHRMGAAGAACLLLPVSDLVAIAQLLDGTIRIGTGDLAFARQTATDIASEYAAKPTTDTIRAARAHAYTLLDLLKHSQMSPEIERQLRSIASDAASLAGYADLNAGKLDKADRWFDKALTLARQAGDRRLEALALVGCAWIPLYAPESDLAATLAALETAAEFQRFLPPAGRASVFGYLAWQHATRGDDLASGRFLEHARTAAGYIPHAEPGWGWWSIHGELAGWEGVRADVCAGWRSLGLKRPAEALQLFDAAFKHTTLPVRRASLYEDLTDACVGVRDPDRACAFGKAALDEAKTHELGLFREKIRKARKTFPPKWNTLAPVIELDERLRLAT